MQLQQVMLNLIINAIQAMSEVAGRARNLHVTTSKDAAEGIRVAVLDSGPGLGTSNPERVFEVILLHKTQRHGDRAFHLPLDR